MRPYVFKFYLLSLLYLTTACVSLDSKNKEVSQQTQDYVTNYYAALAAYERSDYVVALASFKKLAIAGDALSQLYVGNMYERGEGVAQSVEEAVRWYRLAAEQGCVDAQVNLAEVYSNGVGVVRDDVQAYMWLTVAAEQGEFGAQQERRAIEARMTSEEIITAQRWVAEWHQLKHSNSRE